MLELASGADLEEAVIVTISKGRGKCAEDKAVFLILAGWKTTDKGFTWDSPRGVRYRGPHLAWIAMRRQAKRRQRTA
jgi:hypothetical protein